jgi:hypothetical protein
VTLSSKLEPTRLRDISLDHVASAADNSNADWHSSTEEESQSIRHNRLMRRVQGAPRDLGCWQLLATDRNVIAEPIHKKSKRSSSGLCLLWLERNLPIVKLSREDATEAIARTRRRVTEHSPFCSQPRNVIVCIRAFALTKIMTKQKASATMSSMPHATTLLQMLILATATHESNAWLNMTVAVVNASNKPRSPCMNGTCTTSLETRTQEGSIKRQRKISGSSFTCCLLTWMARGTGAQMEQQGSLLQSAPLSGALLEAVPTTSCCPMTCHVLLRVWPVVDAPHKCPVLQILFPERDKKQR